MVKGEDLKLKKILPQSESWIGMASEYPFKEFACGDNDLNLQLMEFDASAAGL